MNQSKSRARKISLQNNYAFGIISPVSTSSLPVPVLNNPSISRPIEIAGMETMENVLPDELGSGDESLKLGPDMNTPSRGFRRWSICNYQQLGQPVAPSVTELISDFASDEETSSQISRSSSSSSMTWLSGILFNIPERIRKLSTEKTKFDVNNLQEDEDVRDQLKKIYVY